MINTICSISLDMPPFQLAYLCLQVIHSLLFTEQRIHIFLFEQFWYKHLGDLGTLCFHSNLDCTGDEVRSLVITIWYGAWIVYDAKTLVIGAPL